MADTVTIIASKDNSLYEAPGLPALSGATGDLFSGGTAQQNDDGNALRRRALFTFPVGVSIPAGATITSATLTLRMTKTISGANQFDLHRMLADWGEGNSANGNQARGVPATPGDVTWNFRFFGDPTSAWTTPGGDFSPLISGSASVGGVGSYSWSGPGMVNDVQAWLNGSAPNDGWALIANVEALTGTAKRFSSRETGSGANRPTLVVGYTIPAPGAAVPMLLGVIGLSRRRRRVP